MTFTGAVDTGGKPVHTLKFKNGGWITLKTAVLTVKNLNIVVEGKDGAVQAFAQIRGESVQNYENCVFTASGKRGSDSAEGNFFAINNVATGKIVTLHMKDCTINATHTGTVKKAWLINRTND